MGNTNAAILSAAAGGLPKTSITALTRLDHNRATSLAASKMGLPCDELEGVIIWGNHSSTQYPDVRHAKSSTSGARVMDFVEHEYLEGEFLSVIQKRGAAIIAARKLSSAASAAKAICDHLRDWALGSNGRAVSMGVYSDGTLYGAPSGVYYSMPVKCTGGGAYEVVQGLLIDDFSRGKMKATGDELAEELTSLSYCSPRERWAEVPATEVVEGATDGSVQATRPAYDGRYNYQVRRVSERCVCEGAQTMERGATLAAQPFPTFRD